MTLDNLEQRVIELENKLAFQDDTIEQLHHELNAHQEAMTLMKRQMQLLGSQFKQVKDELDIEQSGENRGISYERPPHY